VKMGAVALTQPQPYELGYVWSSKAVKMDDEFSFEFKFRISGSKRHEAGESLAIFMVKEGMKIVSEDTSFYGTNRNFEGLVIAVTTDHPGTKGDVTMDPQKITLYASDGKNAPIELGSCLRILFYDENRDDFVPSHASTIRMTYKQGRIVMDIDPRNTQRWSRCLANGKISDVLPESSEMWYESLIVGIVAKTGEKRTRFEAMTFKLYDKFRDASELASPDWNGAEGDRALKIAHQLEHMLFEVKDSIEQMLDQLGEKALRDIQRIEALEAKLSNSAFVMMEERLGEVEKRLTTVSTPIVEARVKQVEMRANHRLEHFKNQTNSSSKAWLKPFFVILGILTIFAFYSYREYKAMNKWNKNYM